MTMTLTDPKRLEQLSDSVEASDLDAPLEGFIQSLCLPPDEENAVIDSLKMLPDPGAAPSALPKSPPAVAGPNVWT